ncbi:MAG: phosphoadenosine phosphosulfate reductase family protein, partial [Polaribacter sp.]
MNLEEINKELQNKSPEEIINWAITIAYKPIVTTNFRPYEVAILDAVTAVKKDVMVVWCDTGYNTQQTYKHAEEIIKRLNLNIHLYTPKQTVAHRNVVLGIPSIEDPEHTIFTEQVKLEPFSRAMKE